MRQRQVELVETTDPVAPVVLRLRQLRLRVHRVAVPFVTLVRRQVAQHESMAASGLDVEVAADRVIFQHEAARPAEHDFVGADLQHRAIGDACDPRRHLTVVEARHRVHARGHAPAQTLHHAHEPRRAGNATQRHEVDDADGAVSRVQIGFQHQRVTLVALLAVRELGQRCNRPMAIGRAAD